MENEQTRKSLQNEEVTSSKNDEITREETKEEKEERAMEVIISSNDMSSKFAKTGRSIILALVAGSWILLYYFRDKNPGTEVFIKYALLLAFIYLLIDLFYYCITMIVYHNFVDFNIEEETLSVKDNHKSFATQAKIQRRFMYLSGLKLLILFTSVVFICCFIFLN